MTIVEQIGYPAYIERRHANASVLYEMPQETGNEERQEYHYEEREVGDSGRMPRMWHQDVQDRKELRQKLPEAG